MRNIRYKDIQGGCMNIQGGIRWSAVNIRMYSERSLYKDMGMSIRKAVRDIRMGKEGGRRRVGGLRNPALRFSKRTQEFFAGEHSHT